MDKTQIYKNIPARTAQTQTLLEAKFDPRLKKYVLYGGVLACVFSIVGILLIPLWLIIGRYYINRYFESLHCELTTRALHFRKGVWFHIERTIPLDKIQDLTFREGPLLRYFGLSTLRIETAGQSAQSASDMSLTGIVDSADFRLNVLDQRDKVTERGGESPQADSSGQETLVSLLTEIRDSLKSIESGMDTQK